MRRYVTKLYYPEPKAGQNPAASPVAPQTAGEEQFRDTDTTLLEQVHEKSGDYKTAMAELPDSMPTLAMERDIDLHKLFYSSIKKDENHVFREMEMEVLIDYTVEKLANSAPSTTAPQITTQDEENKLRRRADMARDLRSLGGNCRGGSSGRIGASRPSFLGIVPDRSQH